MIAPTVIILASGRGERFTASGGAGHKLQALLHGKPVLEHTLAAVQASALPWHLEDAGHPGMGDSIACAVRATPNANGWLILPADLPLIQPATLLAIARALQQHAVVFPSHQGQRGHPVGFARTFFTQLAGLQGEKGAARWLAGAHELVVQDVGCVMDIDTVQDLARAQGIAHHHTPLF